ncbi:MLP-like protein 31 [Cucurbita moschata]|uniref:MLP-like protein 31 n=1 Tax=Cucurbita moschata TaxID=3662 RepID=A0A6J1FST2_CUCMO|nr:MLP-like protein 31 [Cucurbita moschata]
MSGYGKLQADIEIKSPPSKFYEMCCKRPYHVSNASGDRIQSCELHKGEWGKAGSVICWNYFHDGKARVSEHLIEAVNDDENLIVFRVIDGDLLENHKEFKFTMQATPKGKGSMVHWTLEYEKHHENIQEAYSLLEFVVGMSRDIDAHLMEGK